MFALLTIGLLGVAVMRLSDRLGPGENADDLAARRARTSRSPACSPASRCNRTPHPLPDWTIRQPVADAQVS